MSLTTNVHNVVSVSLSRVQFGDFHTLTFKCVDDKGTWFEFTALSAERLEVETGPDRSAVDQQPILETA